MLRLPQIPGADWDRDSPLPRLLVLLGARSPGKEGVGVDEVVDPGRDDERATMVGGWSDDEEPLGPGSRLALGESFHSAGNNSGG